MRKTSFVVSNAIEVMKSQNASDEDIQNATAEIIDGLDITTNQCSPSCDFTSLESFPISYCRNCGFVNPF